MTSVITQLSLISYSAWHQTGTEKVITLNSPSSKHQLSLTFKPEKMKSELKLLTETCNLLNFQSKFFSIQKSIIFTVFILNWAKITTKKYYQPFVTKFWEPSLLSFQLLNFSLKEIKYQKESELFFLKELLISILSLITSPSPNWPSAKNISRLSKANKSLNKRPRELSMKLIKPNKLKSQPLLKPRLQQDPLNWLVKPQLTIHVLINNNRSLFGC